MKRNEKREQLYSIIIFSAILGLFIYMKMSPSAEITEYKIIEENDSVADVINDKVEEIISEISNDKLLIESKEVVLENPVISFTKKELDRAQSYRNKNWAPDATINIAAWEHVLLIKNESQANNVKANDMIHVVNSSN